MLMRSWCAAIVAVLLLASAPTLAQQAQPQPAPTAPSTPAPAPAPAQAPQPAEPAPQVPAETMPTGVPAPIADQIARIAAAVDVARQSVERVSDSDADLARVRADVDKMTAELATITETLRPLLAAARRQVESLGPVPSKTAAPEAPAVAAERTRLNAVVANIDGALRTVDLTGVRIRELIQTITDARQSLFTRNLFERSPSPLVPHHWRRASRDIPATHEFGKYVLLDWFRIAQVWTSQLVLLLLAALAAWIGLGLLVRWIERINDTPPPDGRTFIQRAQKIAWIAPARGIPVVLALAILYLGLQYLDLMIGPGGQIIVALFWSILLASLVSTLIRAVLSPRDPSLRLVDLNDRAAVRISWYLIGIVLLYSVDLALSEIGRVLVAPLSLTVVRTFVGSLAYAGLLTGLLLTRFERQPIRSPDSDAVVIPATSRLDPLWLKLPLWLVTLLIMALSLLGYLALGRFIAQQLVLTGTVMVAAGLVYLTIRSVTRTMEQPANPIGNALSTRLHLEQTRINEFAWLVEVLLTIALLLIAVPLVLVQWGFTAADIRDWFTRAFFGFEIGQFRVSPARILIAIILFIGLLLATRMFQRWLRERVLQPRRLDIGIANSIETAVGYSGIALSAVLAVSYGGLDITNLAIVAGALSLGIGFGLQSIVNNFVSGLILLVERPVKVGDRIVVGDQEGFVRRISVRSTEIETFDRARLIVPNSALITGSVLNKTHRSLMGRGTVRVGATYDADPEQVIAIMLACANAHPQVLTEPPPGAIFENFGASSLDFFMWFFVADVGRAGNIQSDLRIAIMKEFKTAGIEIPFNQHDVHLRDLDGVRALINRIAEERAPKSPASQPPPANGARPEKKRADNAEDIAVEPQPPAPDDRAPTEPPPGSPPARGG